jgi:hypothetical protein
LLLWTEATPIITFPDSEESDLRATGFEIVSRDDHHCAADERCLVAHHRYQTELISITES